MTALTNQTIADSFGDLLQVSNSGSGVDGTLRDVSDGKATTGAFQLSSTGVKFTGTVAYGSHSIAFGGVFSTGGTFSTTGTFSTGGAFSTGGTFSTSSTFAVTGALSIGAAFTTTAAVSITGAFTIAAAFTTSGANPLTLTTTGTTNVTLPTSGTLATTAASLQVANNLSDVNSAATATLNLVSVNAITGAATGVFGALNKCTGSSAYTVTLPAVSANKIIEFSIQTTSNAIVTISPASGTIDGQATKTYGSNEGCVLFCDGANWFTYRERLQPVTVRAYLNSDQTITAGNTSKITIDTETFDIGGFYDHATNYRFTPLYAGKYEVNFDLQTAPIGNGDTITLYVYKNGAAISQKASAIPSTSATSSFMFSITDLVDMNGSTDYLEVYVRATSSGGNPVVKGVSTNPQTKVTYKRLSNF